MVTYDGRKRQTVPRYIGTESFGFQKLDAVRRGHLGASISSIEENEKKIRAECGAGKAREHSGFGSPGGEYLAGFD